MINMNSYEKILKAIEALHTDVKTLKEVQQVHGKWLDNIENRSDTIEAEEKKQCKKLNKIEKLVSYIAKYNDDLHINLRTRVEKLEDRIEKRDYLQPS